MLSKERESRARVKGSGDVELETLVDKEEIEI